MSPQGGGDFVTGPPTTPRARLSESQAAAAPRAEALRRLPGRGRPGPPGARGRGDCGAQDPAGGARTRESWVAPRRSPRKRERRGAAEKHAERYRRARGRRRRGHRAGPGRGDHVTPTCRSCRCFRCTPATVAAVSTTERPSTAFELLDIPAPATAASSYPPGAGGRSRAILRWCGSGSTARAQSPGLRVHRPPRQARAVESRAASLLRGKGGCGYGPGTGAPLPLLPTLAHTHTPVPSERDGDPGPLLHTTFTKRSLIAPVEGQVPPEDGVLA